MISCADFSLLSFRYCLRPSIMSMVAEDEVGEDLVELLGPMIGYWQDRGLDEK